MVTLKYFFNEENSLDYRYNNSLQISRFIFFFIFVQPFARWFPHQVPHKFVRINTWTSLKELLKLLIQQQFFYYHESAFQTNRSRMSNFEASQDAKRVWKCIQRLCPFLQIGNILYHYIVLGSNFALKLYN